ncbi:phage tail protein I [Maridesulfovibrio sp.]|uniref:phage tail protein I n=1 Tax=unclassified Maridesulfovibrio TaxID=2794999 RepID=UPI003B0057A5
MADLLPISATPQERALSEVTGNRIESIPVPIRDLWNPWKCPLELLPWLAWALSVDWWDDAWSEDVKRKMVAGSIAIHRHKGTPWAVKEYLKILGYRDAQIIEGVEPLRHDSQHQRGGLYEYVNPGHWALFRVVCDLGNDMGLDASTNGQVVNAINLAKNLRSHLYAVGYRITLSDSNETSRAESLKLRLGLKLSAKRPAVRDGSFSRSSAGAWVRDGNISYGGVDRSGSVSGPYFGLPSFRCPVTIGLQSKSSRAARCPRDGSINYAGRSRASGAPLDRCDYTSIRQTIARDGSRARSGNYGALVVRLSAEDAFPARDGRYCRDGSIRHCHTHMEAIA